MDALVYHGPGNRVYKEKRVPIIRSSADAYRQDRKDNRYGRNPPMTA